MTAVADVPAAVHAGTPADTAPLPGTLLDDLQSRSFGYFVHEGDPRTGLVLDKTASGWPASIAAVGMALTAYPVGVERGWMARDHAARRTLATLRFFWTSDQRGTPESSGHKGFYFHYLDMATGRRAWASELSSIDTALLIAGMLTARAYFDRDDAVEAEIRDLARQLYERVDWRWMQARRATLSHGWRQRRGFLRWHWQGYDEAMLLYLLALGSPTHPVAPEAWQAWTSTFRWRDVEGIEHLHAGPLFIHQLSHVWIDLRGVQDAFMRDHGCDYFENSRRATLAQQRYAVRNPKGFVGYGEHAWGLTASDGPGPRRRQTDGVRRTFFDYVARGIPDGPDDGTLAPWAVVASLPFAPEIVLPTLAHFDRLNLRTCNPYGFKASFNPTFDGTGCGPCGWVSPYHFGLNEGPAVAMVENHRSGLVWSLMRQCEPLRRGLRRAGFTGGWLDG